MIYILSKIKYLILLYALIISLVSILISGNKRDRGSNINERDVLVLYVQLSHVEMQL